jgi:hypothetical protein
MTRSRWGDLMRHVPEKYRRLHRCLDTVRAKWIGNIMIRRDDTLPMKNPVHPGMLAKANLDELNLSVAEAAKR